MRSLERKFNNIAQLNPYWSSYICFAEAIRNHGFNKRTIMFHFNKLVNRDDYSKKEKKAIIDYLVSLTSKNEDGG